MKLDLYSGSRLKLASAMWPAYYEAVLRLIGSTGSILPIGDPQHGQPDATTFKTVGGEQITFTWSSAPDSWATPFDPRKDSSWQGIIPVLDFDGSNDEADTPDADYWSRDDGAASEDLSIGAWIQSAGGANDAIFSRLVSGAREWHLNTGDSGDTLRFSCVDESEAILVRRDQDSAFSINQWHFLVATYDGTGGASAMNGVILYLDGSVVASSASNNAGYAAMEGSTSTTSLGRIPSALSYWDGKIAGGPMGLWFTQVVMTTDQIRRLYELGRRALAL